MSKLYDEVREVKEVTTRKYLKTVCDWCGDEIIPEPYGSGQPESEIEFRLQKKVDYREDGGYGEEWALEDLCIRCLDRMVALLQAQKVGLVRKELDW